MCRTTKRLGSKTATSQNIYRILNLPKNSKLWLFRQIFDFIFGFHSKKFMISKFLRKKLWNCEKPPRRSTIWIDPNFRKFLKSRLLKDSRWKKVLVTDYSEMYTYLTFNNHKCKPNVKSSISDIWKIEKVEMQACRPWVRRVCHGTPRFWQIS